MANPYSISSTDDIPHKSMVVGRLHDAISILKLLNRNFSVLLYGERRIGKTLLLWILRDIINGDINKYTNKLFDDDLRRWLSQESNLNSFSFAKNASCLFINLQAFNPTNINDITDYIFNRYFESNNTNNLSFIDMCKHVNDQAGGKVVFFIDEMEVLLSSRFKDANIVYEQIRSSIQECPNVSFVLAGAENWFKASSNEASPLYGNCSNYYLNLPNEKTIKKYLLFNPLKECGFNDKKASEYAKLILKYSGCKPFYCQAIGYEVIEQKNIDKAIKSVFESFSEQIHDYFTKLSNTSHSIMIFLVFNKVSSKSQIKRYYKFTNKEMQRSIDELLYFGKICKIGNKYKLNGLIFENWGKEHFDAPRTVKLNLKYLKIIVSATFLIFAFVTYWYTHPPNKEYKIVSSKYSVFINMPMSIESGESGNGYIYILPLVNVGSKLIVNSLSNDVRLWFGNDSYVELTWSYSGSSSNKKEFSYVVSEKSKGEYSKTTIAINNTDYFTFSFKRRQFAFKSSWKIISGFLAFISMLFQYKLFVYIFNRFIKNEVSK